MGGCQFKAVLAILSKDKIAKLEADLAAKNVECENLKDDVSERDQKIDELLKNIGEKTTTIQKECDEI